MTTELINETVEAGVVFKKGGRPVLKWFLWNGRRVDVGSISGVWRQKAGTAAVVYFSVADKATSYELSFNQASLTWVLEKVHVEG